LAGVPKAGDEAAAVLGETSRAVREALSKKLLPDVMVRGNTYIGGAGGGDSNFVKATRGDNNPGPLDEKVYEHGSIEATESGLRLKGDNLAIMVDDVVYGTHKGQRGFHKLKDFDSDEGEAKRVGIVGVGGIDPCTDTARDEAATWQTLTRLSIETDEKRGVKILYQCERDVRISATGRVVEVGAERRSQVGFISGGMTTQIGLMGCIKKDPDDPDSPYIPQQIVLEFTDGLLTGSFFGQSFDKVAEVVVGMDYTNPEFKMKKRKIFYMDPDPNNEEPETEEVVFETTPLTEDET
jgi:hypothetical protein